MRLMLVAQDTYALYLRLPDGKESFLGIFTIDERLQDLGFNGPKEEVDK